MKANLSLMLDLEGKIRLDLIHDQELTEIDKYTAVKVSHDDIREDFREYIDKFLEENKNFTGEFKRENNKKGSIVITFTDEFNNLRKLRVLYSDNIAKLDAGNVLASLVTYIKGLKSYNDSEKIVDNFRTSIFASPFDQKILRTAKEKVSFVRGREDFNVTDTAKKQCSNLNNLIKNKLVGEIIDENNKSNYNRGYYHIRLLDSYIEKAYRYSTTKKHVKLSKGTITYDANIIPKVNKELSKTSEPVEVVKDSIKYNNQELTEDNDGQYSFVIPKDKNNPQRSYREYVDEILNKEDREAPPIK